MFINNANEKGYGLGQGTRKGGGAGLTARKMFKQAAH